MPRAIVNAAEIIAGQFYIRCFVNCYGDVRAMVYRVLGKPFSDGFRGDRQSWKIRYDAPNVMYGPSEGYLSDFMGHYGPINGNAHGLRRCGSPRSCGLFRFDNSLLAKVNALVEAEDGRGMMDLINNRPLSDNEWYDEVDDHEHAIAVDHYYEKKGY